MYSVLFIPSFPLFHICSMDWISRSLHKKVHANKVEEEMGSDSKNVANEVEGRKDVVEEVVV